MEQRGQIIDAAVRFLRTNPQLLAYAQSAAAASGVSVDALLADTVARARGEVPESLLDTIAVEQLTLRPAAAKARRGR